MANKGLSTMPPIISDASSSIDQKTVDIEKVEASIKRLLRDLKKYMEAVQGLQKVENKCVSDLLQSPICGNSKYVDPQLRATAKMWSSSMNGLDTALKEANSRCSKMCTDPLKDYICVLSNYHVALRKREIILQENIRAVARWKKIEKDGKFSVTTAKLNELRQFLIETETAVDTLNQQLQTDMGTLTQKSTELFEPVLIGFEHTQVVQYKTAYDVLAALFSHNRPDSDVISEKSLEAEMKRFRKEMESLSIVQTSAPSDVPS